MDEEDFKINIVQMSKKYPPEVIENVVWIQVWSKGKKILQEKQEVKLDQNKIIVKNEM